MNVQPLLGSECISFSSPVDPRQVVLWGPPEVDRALRHYNSALDATDYEYASTSLGHSQRGDRAAVYEAGDGRGIVALFDFGGPPVRQDSWGRLAPGILRPLLRPISRAELLANPVLAPPLRKIRGRRRLNAEQGAAITALVGEPVPFALLQTDPADHGDFDGPVADPGRSFGTEAAMQEAIATSARAYRCLGFRRSPERESWSDDGQRRFDLVDRGLRVLAELKLEGTRSALEQVDDYL